MNRQPTLIELCEGGILRSLVVLWVAFTLLKLLLLVIQELPGWLLSIAAIPMIGLYLLLVLKASRFIWNWRRKSKERETE